MTPGLSKDIQCHVLSSMLANHQTRHQAACKLGCQPGDCSWPLDHFHGFTRILIVQLLLSNIFNTYASNNVAFQFLKLWVIQDFAYILSSAAKPGTHFLENKKIIGVFTMSRNATKTKPLSLYLGCADDEIDPLQISVKQ